MKISVAMATYNGAKYIREQLQSLMNQTFLPYELVIGDDGSTDATLDIIDDFHEHAPFPIRVHQNENNLGFGRNFLATAKRCQGDWVAFCDQDDVWLPSKLAGIIKAVEDMPNCCMVLQNAWLCDESLNSCGRKFPDKLSSGIYSRNSQYGFWVWPGFLQTVHRDIVSLWDYGCLPRNYYPHHPEVSHDKWTCMIANALGGIIVLDKPVALYRRHKSAVTGDYKTQSIRRRVLKARNVSSESYEFFAKVAVDYAEYMQNLVNYTDNDEWVSVFKESSHNFYKLSLIQELRSQLYLKQRFLEKLRFYLKIVCSGGYVGPSFYAMGLKSAAKDLMRVIVRS